VNRATAVGLIAALGTLAFMAVQESSPLIHAAVKARTARARLDPKNHLLAALHACAQTIPHDGTTSFTAACTTLNVTGLSGVTRAALQDALGPPQLCLPDGSGVPPGGTPPGGTTCRQPAWSFYYLPPSARGGGPELVCRAPDGLTCRRVDWTSTE
jgi:hypothetical protein